MAALKAEPGQGLLKFGTGSFTRTLLEHRLIDELHVWRFPVTHLELLDVTTFGSGIVVQDYGSRSD